LKPNADVKLHGATVQQALPAVLTIKIHDLRGPAGGKVYVGDSFQAETVRDTQAISFAFQGRCRSTQEPERLEFLN
jgi:hypothetical protein